MIAEKRSRNRLQTASLAPLLAAAFSLAFWGCSDGSQNDQPTPPLGPLLLGNAQDMQLMGAIQAAGVVPLDLPAPEDPAIVALGQALFFDKELSGDRNISCATCHHPANTTTDQLPTSIGAGGSGSGSVRSLASGTMIARNAPALFHLGAATTGALFWDGRVSQNPATGFYTTPESALNGSSPTRSDITAVLSGVLSAQALFPLTSDHEMRGQPGNEIRDAAENQATWAAIMARLVGTSNGTVGGLAAYRALFDAAYGLNYDDLNIGHVARAIAAFESAVYRGTDSPFDRYIRGDVLALTPEARRGGLIFFGRAGCANCHNGPALSDFQFHGIAAPQLGPGVAAGDDRGRFEQTGLAADMYTFRTPPLRNVELTAPYTHAGAYASLEAVVRHYNNTAQAARNYDASQLGRADYIATVDTDPARIEARIAARDPRVQNPLRLNPGQQADLVAFLRSLTDPGARDLSATVPTSVPSGLTLAD